MLSSHAFVVIRVTEYGFLARKSWRVGGIDEQRPSTKII